MWPILAQTSSETGGFRGFIDSVARTPLSEVVAFVAVCTVLRLAIYPFLRKTPLHQRSGNYAMGRVFNEFLDAVIYAGVFVFLLIRPFAVQAFLIPSASMNDTLLEGDFIVANKAIYRYSEPKVGDIIVFRPPVIATSKDQRDESGEAKVDFIKRCQGVAGDLVEVKNGILFRNNRMVDEPYVAARNKPMTYDWRLVQYHGVHKEWEGKYIPVITEPNNPSSGPNYNLSKGGIAKTFGVGTHLNTNPESPYPWVSFDEWKTPDQLSDEDKQMLEELKTLPSAKVPPGYVLMMGDNRGNSFDGRAWGLIPREQVIGRSECIWFPLSRWRITR